VTKPDDSTLDPDDLRAVEQRARKTLDRASAWGRFPTPVEDIVAAAKLSLAPTNMFDPARILAFVAGKTALAAHRVKSAISKVLGLYDAAEKVIHIDGTVGESKQNFLKLHETGHHEIPTHKKLFLIFQDCEKTLSPETAELFEREANNFARFALFQDDAYAKHAADCKFEIKTPMNLAKVFGASVYASMREFVRTNPRACVVYVLEPIEFVQGAGVRALVRRIESSPSFAREFGHPTDAVITADHQLGQVLPVGRRMTRPVSVVGVDRNGKKHECVAEAFKTPRNVFVLLYPIKDLTTTTVILPTGFKRAI
jgi:hypothetical protein